MFCQDSLQLAPPVGRQCKHFRDYTNCLNLRWTWKIPASEPGDIQLVAALALGKMEDAAILEDRDDVDVRRHGGNNTVE
jgi:hypothetical protein